MLLCVHRDLLDGHFVATVMLASAVNSYDTAVSYIIPLLYMQDAMQLTLPIMQ